MLTQMIHGLPVQLKDFHDLTWLDEYGQVFCVFDQLISGHLCFGVEQGNDRYFIKYAGAPTLMYFGQAGHAIQRLQASVPLYEELRHPALSELLHAISLPHGFALMFKWFPGYALAPLDIHFLRFRSLPLLSRLSMFDTMMDCMALAEDHDYLIGGLSNRRILVDFDTQKAIFSSASHYARFPASTPYPKLAGAGWYLPPEAYVPGFPLDQRCNIYALGALAFTFFGGQKEPALWEAGGQLLKTALKATRDKPEERVQSIRDFQAEWRAGVLAMREF